MVKDNNDKDNIFSSVNNKKISLTKHEVLLECKNKGPNNKLLKKYKDNLTCLSSIQ
jgi:hypothetical protein